MRTKHKGRNVFVFLHGVAVGLHGAAWGYLVEPRLVLLAQRLQHKAHEKEPQSIHLFPCWTAHQFLPTNSS